MSRLYEVTETPVVTVGAYHAKDAVGGLLTFENAASAYNGGGIIRKVTVINHAGVADVLNLVLFDRTFTATADNAAFDPTDADLLNCIGRIAIAATDYEVLTDNAVATVLCDFPFKLVALGSSLFGQLQCEATPTYAATTDVTVKLTIER